MRRILMALVMGLAISAALQLMLFSGLGECGPATRVSKVGYYLGYTPMLVLRAAAPRAYAEWRQWPHAVRVATALVASTAVWSTLALIALLLVPGRALADDRGSDPRRDEVSHQD